MNIFTTVFTATVLTITTASMANATNIVAADDSVTSKLCVTAAKGSNNSMRHAIKDSRLSKQFIIENVQCNNQPILSFVDQYGKNSEKINYLLTRGRSIEQATKTEVAAR